MYKQNILINFPSILLIFLPFFLITGPFLADLAVSLISLLFIIKIFIEKDYSIFRNKYFQIFLIFWIYLLFNSLVQNQNIDSLRISLFYFRFGFFIFAIAFLLRKKKDNAKLFFYSLLACFIALIIDGSFQYIVGKNLFGYTLHVGPRVSSFFGEELIMGSYLSRLFPLLLGLHFYLKFKKNSKKFNLLMLFIFISLEILIFLSGERSSFFYLNLTAIFFIIFIKDYRSTTIFILSLSLILIFLLIQFNHQFSKRMINQTLEEMNLLSLFNFSSVEKKVIFSQHHTDHYLTSLNMFKDNVILGVGIKNFRKFCSDEKYSVSKTACASHSHNTYIQLLAETGIIGFLFIIYFLLLLFYYYLKHLKLSFYSKSFLSPYQVCLLTSVLITLWPIVPSGNFFNNWLSIIYYLPLGFILHSFGEKKP